MFRGGYPGPVTHCVHLRLRHGAVNMSSNRLRAAPGDCVKIEDWAVREKRVKICWRGWPACRLATSRWPNKPTPRPEVRTPWAFLQSGATRPVVKPRARGVGTMSHATTGVRIYLRSPALAVAPSSPNISSKTIKHSPLKFFHIYIPRAGTWIRYPTAQSIISRTTTFDF